jgi:hypothetical protein
MAIAVSGAAMNGLSGGTPKETQRYAPNVRVQGGTHHQKPNLKRRKEEGR